MNLERSKVKEEVQVMDDSIAGSHDPLQDGKLDQKIKDTENRMLTQLANLKTIIETQKLDIFKYLAGN